MKTSGSRQPLLLPGRLSGHSSTSQHLAPLQLLFEKSGASRLEAVSSAWWMNFANNFVAAKHWVRANFQCACAKYVHFIWIQPPESPWDRIEKHPDTFGSDLGLVSGVCVSRCDEESFLLQSEHPQTVSPVVEFVPRSTLVFSRVIFEPRIFHYFRIFFDHQCIH